MKQHNQAENRTISFTEQNQSEQKRLQQFLIQNDITFVRNDSGNYEAVIKLTQLDEFSNGNGKKSQHKDKKKLSNHQISSLHTNKENNVSKKQYQDGYKNQNNNMQQYLNDQLNPQSFISKQKKPSTSPSEQRNNTSVENKRRNKQSQNKNNDLQRNKANSKQSQQNHSKTPPKNANLILKQNNDNEQQLFQQNQTARWRLNRSRTPEQSNMQKDLEFSASQITKNRPSSQATNTNKNINKSQNLNFLKDNQKQQTSEKISSTSFEKSNKISPNNSQMLKISNIVTQNSPTNINGRSRVISLNKIENNNQKRSNEFQFNLFENESDFKARNQRSSIQDKEKKQAQKKNSSSSILKKSSKDQLFMNTILEDIEGKRNVEKQDSKKNTSYNQSLHLTKTAQFSESDQIASTQKFKQNDSENFHTPSERKNSKPRYDKYPSSQEIMKNMKKQNYNPIQYPVVQDSHNYTPILSTFSPKIKQQSQKDQQSNTKDKQYTPEKRGYFTPDDFSSPKKQQKQNKNGQSKSQIRDSPNKNKGLSKSDLSINDREVQSITKSSKKDIKDFTSANTLKSDTSMYINSIQTDKKKQFQKRSQTPEQNQQGLSQSDFSLNDRMSLFKSSRLSNMQEVKLNVKSNHNYSPVLVNEYNGSRLSPQYTNQQQYFNNHQKIDDGNNIESNFYLSSANRSLHFSQLRNSDKYVHPFDSQDFQTKESQSIQQQQSSQQQNNKKQNQNFTKQISFSDKQLIRESDEQPHVFSIDLTQQEGDQPREIEEEKEDEDSNNNNSKQQNERRSKSSSRGSILLLNTNNVQGGQNFQKQRKDNHFEQDYFSFNSQNNQFSPQKILNSQFMNVNKNDRWLDVFKQDDLNNNNQNQKSQYQKYTQINSNLPKHHTSIELIEDINVQKLSSNELIHYYQFILEKAKQNQYQIHKPQNQSKQRLNDIKQQ